MSAHFTLRMQFGIHQDAGWVRDRLLEFLKGAPVDEIMFFFYAEDMNLGHESLEEVGRWLEHSRVYREAVREAGVTVSVNPWHTLLHEDRDRTLRPDQKWQTMVSPTGRAASAVVCPLDAGWRDYYADVLRLYAAEDFARIWIDDDFRFHNHPPLDWGGCFCPLHVAEFNRRAGVEATRDEIVRNVLAPGEPHRWRAVWLDMWDETQLESIDRWRQIVESAGSRLALMSSLPEVHSAEGRHWAAWWRAFAGPEPGRRAVHRPHFWGYEDLPSEGLPNAVALLDMNRVVQPGGGRPALSGVEGPEHVDSGPELEGWSNSRWHRSFRQNSAQTALAHVFGSTHVNISFHDFLGNDPTDEPERQRFLRNWKPVSDWLSELFGPSLAPVGVGIPWDENMGRKVHTDGTGLWQSLVCRPRDWAVWLGAIGHAFAMRPSDAVNAIGGTMAWTHSADDLRRWLSKGVLLDGLAAHILVERGFGDLVGLTSSRMITHADVLYAMENCIDESFGMRAGDRMCVNRYGYADRIVQGDLAEGARIVSDLRDPRDRVVGHGEVLFDNALGGRVAVVPWCVDRGLTLTRYRAVQLAKTLAWLDPGDTVGRVENAVWLVPQFFTDGRRWRAVVWNAGPDDVVEFTLHTPAGMSAPTRATHIDGHSRRYDAFIAPSEKKGFLSRVSLARPMHQWELVVLF